MTASAILFDLDGTLLDTIDDLAHAGNRVLAARGYPVHSVAAYRYFVGDGLAALIDRIVPAGLGPEEKKACFEEFREIYGQCWHRRTTPYPGIEAMLEELAGAGCRLAILSNKPHDFTVACVSHFFPETPFACVLGQREGVPKKPHPRGAIDIARKLEVQPDECIYVGDTRVDMETGKGAGMKTVGVLWGFRERRELEESGADLIITEPAELCRCVAAEQE